MFTPSLRSEADIYRAVELLVDGNLRDWSARGVIDRFPGRVVFRTEPYGQNLYQLAREVLAQGWGDCEDLTAWVIALLRLAGYWAEAVVTYQGRGLYHVSLRYKKTPWDSWTYFDPSLELTEGNNVYN